MKDHQGAAGWMSRALELAAKGIGKTSPNPRVGAVVVRSGKIVGEGYHAKAGGPHAEILALRKAGERARGADLYVSLEPCSSRGRTPPCVEAICRAQIRRVISASADPDPRHRGRARRILAKQGIEYRTGLLTKEAQRLNRPFLKRMRTSLPWVLLKTAQTLDGKIAASTGNAKWITSPVSRRKVQRLRFESDAILTGIRTVLADNPRMDCRSPVKEIPRIVVDSRGRLPQKARIRRTKGPVWLASAVQKKRSAAVDEHFYLPDRNGRVNLKALLKKLGTLQINQLMVEAGGEINASLLEQGLVDEVVFFIAPKILGGREAKTSFEGEGMRLASEAIGLKEVSLEKSGPDLLLRGLL